ncbi:MAG: tetratricopeptide repeat protein, partial [Ignavibacteriae bacterium]|nr:tetratricopeptide repeat protein [Ignavibacteriota bacterium]
MKPNIKFIILLLLVINNSFSQEIEIKPTDTTNIKLFLKDARDTKNDIEVRKDFARKSSRLVFLVKGDSSRNSYFLDLALTYSKLDDSLNFRKYNNLSTLLSQQLNDSTNLANNYWDLAFYFKKNKIKDSAFLNYSKTQKIFERLKDSLYNAKMLFAMAGLQKDMEDYTGSEITTIEAIKIFKNLNDHLNLYDSYNLLGIIFNELGEYEQSIFYHDEALKYLERVEDKGTRMGTSLNNIGVVYQNMNNHAKAIEVFEKALDKNYLNIENPKQYAMLVDNLAFSRFKIKDTVGVANLFKESLKIRDSIGDIAGVTINKLHLAEYYLYKRDSSKALQEAKEVYNTASEIKNYRDKLLALKFLSKVKSDYDYANEYMELSDSLQKEERKIRNKFARIRFETDEFKERTEKLTEQKKTITTVSSIIIAMGLLLFIIWNQRMRNKKLRLEKEQQKSNEEIYNLMLNQQYSVDEGRREIKKRISEELHDGVLGKLFGTRLILGTLNSAKDEESIIKREKYISDLQEVEVEIRNVSHELNEKSVMSDIGYAALIEELLENQSIVGKFNYAFKYDE